MTLQFYYQSLLNDFDDTKTYILRDHEWYSPKSPISKLSQKWVFGTKWEHKSEEKRKMNLNRYSFIYLIPLNLAVIVNKYLENIISIDFISIPGAVNILDGHAQLPKC